METGMAIKQEMATNSIKSFDNKPQMFAVEAPSTLRMPISFTRCSATKEVRPNKPRQEINMANAAKKVDNLPTRFSSLNFLANSSSAKSALKGEAGSCFFK